MGNLCHQKIQQPKIYGDDYKKKVLQSSLNPGRDRITEIKQFLNLNMHSIEPNCLFPNQQTDKNQTKNQHSRQLSDFQVVRGLGKGTFGQVYMVKNKHDSQIYAMKIISKQKIKNEQEKFHTLTERYILEAMDNPFIVKLHYAFQTQNKLYLLVDLMPGGQLFYLLRRNGKFKEPTAKYYLAEILLALEYIHSKKIIYRDLKPENILLDKQGHIKLTDFGLSKVCVEDNKLSYSFCGTPQYIAPQIVQGKGYDQSADWFSFGSLMYDMLTGRPPFYSKDKHEMLKKIATKNVPIPANLSPSAQSLLKGLFAIKPKQRLGYKNDAAQIKQHEFFKEIDFQAMLQKSIKPPLAFSEQINELGFDLNTYYQSIQFDQKGSQNNKQYEGFTYENKAITSSTQNIEEVNEKKQNQEMQNEI